MKIYHLFISHSWKHTNQYTNLVKILNQAPNFHYQNRSIPKDDPVHSGSDRELSEAIRNHMQSCGIVLVMAGVYANHSKWMEKEMRFAKSSWRVPKPILAINPFGSQRTSEDVKNFADEFVNWNTGSIVSAIRRLA